MTGADAVGALLDAMAREGVRPAEPVAARLASGRLVRFRAEGDRPGRRNGWARLAPHGWAFGHWRLGISRAGRLGDAREATRAERVRWARELAAAKARQRAERAAAHARGRKAALALWQGSPGARAAHPYLAGKRMAPDGLRERGRFLLVPMRDPRTGELWNVQRIAPDGAKRFTPDARVWGLVWGRGEPDAPGARVVVCEGVATAAAVHAAARCCAVAAFSKGELATVARAIWARWPGAALAIGADVDPDGGGEAAARAAAGPIGVTVALPPCPAGWTGPGWDFADLWAAGEADAIRAALESGR